MTLKNANFSSCKMYRYSLTRIWDNKKPIYLFVGLNPSTGNEENNDKTLNRLISFVESWNGGGFHIVNLFPYVTPKTEILFSSPKPLGDNSKNKEIIKNLASKSNQIVICWGDDGHRQKQAQDVLNLLKDFDLFCLKINKSGSPKHPLYAKGNLKPIKYE